MHQLVRFLTPFPPHTFDILGFLDPPLYDTLIHFKRAKQRSYDIGGDVMKLQIRVDRDTNTISEVKFKTFGCGSAIASSSYLTELVRGMSLEDAGRIKNTEIAKELCLPPVKLHCSMLAEDAIKSAIKDYQTKSNRGPPTLGKNLL